MKKKLNKYLINLFHCYKKINKFVKKTKKKIKSMGCGINHGNKINVQTEVFIPTKKSNDSIETKNSFNRLTLNNISKKNWLKIIDYLQYQELKEVAKTNRLLNYLSKDDKILIKFFKKKK